MPEPLFERYLFYLDRHFDIGIDEFWQLLFISIRNPAYKATLLSRNV